MPDYTNIKHAYIGATNIKSIYEGSVLRWKEPASEPVTVWRVVRMTAEDILRLNDELVIVLRPNTGTYSGKYIPMQSYETKILSYYPIVPKVSQQLTIKYDYGTIGSDGLRLCHYAEIEDADQYLTYKVVAVGSNQEVRLRKLAGGDNTWLTRVQYSIGGTKNVFTLDTLNGSCWFTRKRVSDRSEANLPDESDIDQSWAGYSIGVDSNYYLNGNIGTYMSYRFVTWSQNETTNGNAYILKKVTAQL